MERNTFATVVSQAYEAGWRLRTEGPYMSDSRGFRWIHPNYPGICIRILRKAK